MKKQLRSYGIITVGSVIFALSFDWFFAANAVGMGGITGLAQVLNVLFPALSVGIGTILLNVPLFLAGWKFIGFHLLASSLFSMTVSSLAMDGIALLYTFSPMDPMLASICGGAMMGAGLGIVFSQGATTGGTDIVARLLKLKFPWLPMGKLILIPDGVVLALTAIAFQRLETALYGAVALYVSSKVMDTVLYGLNASKVAYIISNHWQKISDAILAYDRGVTILNATGAYSGSEKHVLMVAFRQREIVEIKEIVHEADPAAFLIVCDSAFATAEEAADYLDRSIDGVSVGIGGSVTAEQMGLYEKLSGHNRVFWHWRPESAEDPRREAMTADMYITSVNGIAETGELINIDGNGNRVASSLYGHKKVWFIVGRNKLAPTYEEALWRARNIAAPKNAQRLGRKTPCAVHGDRCYDCKSPERICRGLVVLWEAVANMEMEVVLIDQDLGY